MRILTDIKNLSINFGLYGPALWFSRQLRPTRIKVLHDDIIFFKSLLPNSALCFDVGANRGGKSEAMLKAGMRVVAFEPSQEALIELRARCSKNPLWTLMPAAVGSEPGIAKLYCRQDSGLSSLRDDWIGETINTEYVPVVTLDNAIKTFGNPFYCKIDVEGWELEVLEGTHSSSPIIVI